MNARREAFEEIGCCRGGLGLRDGVEVEVEVEVEMEVGMKRVLNSLWSFVRKASASGRFSWTRVERKRFGSFIVLLRLGLVAWS